MVNLGENFLQFFSICVLILKSQLVLQNLPPENHHGSRGGLRAVRIGTMSGTDTKKF